MVKEYDPLIAAQAEEVSVFVCNLAEKTFDLSYQLPVTDFNYKQYESNLLAAIEHIIGRHLLFLKSNGYKPEDVMYAQGFFDPENVIRVKANRIVATANGFDTIGVTLGVVQFPSYCRIAKA